MEHTNNYNLLMQRFTNGIPFLKADGHKQVERYALKLDPKVLTQDEAIELHSVVDQYGADELPADANERITSLELKVEENAAQATYTAMMTNTLMEV